MLNIKYSFPVIFFYIATLIIPSTIVNPFVSSYKFSCELLTACGQDMSQHLMKQNHACVTRYANNPISMKERAT